MENTFYFASSDPSTGLGTQKVLVMTLLVLFIMIINKSGYRHYWGHQYTSLLMYLVISRDLERRDVRDIYF